MTNSKSCLLLYKQSLEFYKAQNWLPMIVYIIMVRRSKRCWFTDHYAGVSWSSGPNRACRANRIPAFDISFHLNIKVYDGYLVVSIPHDRTICKYSLHMFKCHNLCVWQFYDHFWSFFCQLHKYLLQNLDADGHYEVQNVSKF